MNGYTLMECKPALTYFGFIGIIKFERMCYLPLTKEDFYTIEDIYDLPEGTRAELIDGKIYYMAPPSRQHQKLSVNFHF